MSYYRQQLEDWLKNLDVRADKVLDIGGAQGSVKGRTKSWDVAQYEILDLPDFDMNLMNSLKPEHYDADLIFCLEVFEYLYNPWNAIQNIKGLLKKGGKAYVTFAFVYPLHQEVELDSLRYTETGVNRLAKAAGLKVANIDYRFDRSGYLEMFYQADGMHPAKGYPYHNATGFIVEFTK